MEKENESRCPNCVELWKRIDELSEQKAKAQRWQGAQFVVSILLFVGILVNFGLLLIR